MINYYNVIDATKNSSTNAIRAKIEKANQELIKNPNSEQQELVNEAAMILLNDKKRIAYNKKLDRIEFLNKHGIRFTACSFTAIAALVLTLNGCKNGTKKPIKVVPTKTPTTKVIPTVVPTPGEKVVTPTPTVIPTPTVTPTPTVSTFNITDMTSLINDLLVNYEEKGLTGVTKEMLVSAIVVTNIKDVTNEDIKTIYGDNFSIDKAINDTDMLTSLIATHNNKIKDEKNYIWMSNLSFNLDDKIVLNGLDEFNIWLFNSIKENKIDKEIYQIKYENISSFYKEINDYGYYTNLTAGAKNLADAYFMVSGTSFVKCNALTKVQLKDIENMSVNVCCGKSLSEIIELGNELTTKQLTK